MECLACWPFGTKGHYHLPSAFSPVLADFVARSRFLRSKNSELTFVHDSWNVQGKHTDYQAIITLTGLNVKEIEKRYEEIITKRLREIIDMGKEVATYNIKVSKSIKDRLGLLPSGLYSERQLIKPLEFRDDSEISWKTAQGMFLQLYNENFIYWNKNSKKPQFFLDMSKLLSEGSLEKLLEGTDMPSFVVNDFKNNYKFYLKDMPLSAIRAYATPLPLYISKTGKLIVPNERDLPIDPRIDGICMGGSVIRNLPLSIKPLFNLYFLDTILEEMVGRRFTCITLSNDQSLRTRFNFPQLLISTFLSKNKKKHKQIFYELLIDEHKRRFSFKENLTLSLEDLTKEGPTLARFTVAKNLKLGGGEVIFQQETKTYQKLMKIVKDLKTRERTKEGLVESGLFKKMITDFESSYAPIIESFDIRRGINFLVDYLFRANKIEGRLPNQVDIALKYLDAMLCIKKD